MYNIFSYLFIIYHSFHNHFFCPKISSPNTKAFFFVSLLLPNIFSSPKNTFIFIRKNFFHWFFFVSPEEACPSTSSSIYPENMRSSDEDGKDGMYDTSGGTCDGSRVTSRHFTQVTCEWLRHDARLRHARLPRTFE